MRRNKHIPTDNESQDGPTLCNTNYELSTPPHLHPDFQGVAPNGATEPYFNRDYGVDLLKAIAAFFVVVIHSHGYLSIYGRELADSLSAISRLGVGVFFMITGYYLPSLIGRGRLKGHIKKVFVLALWSCLVYLIFNSIYFELRWGDYTEPLKNITAKENIWIQLILNEVKFEIHLWYLFAAGYSIIFCGVFYNLGKKKALYVIAFVLLIIGLCLQYLEKPHYIFRNWIFYGIPYVSIGILIKEQYASLEKIEWKYLVIALLASITNCVFEALVYSSYRDYYFLTFLGCATLMICAIRVGPYLNKRVKEGNRWIIGIVTVGLKYSVYIYIFHFIIKHFLDFIIKIAPIEPFYIYGIFPVLIYLLSLLMAIVWTRFKRRPF